MPLGSQLLTLDQFHVIATPISDYDASRAHNYAHIPSLTDAPASSIPAPQNLWKTDTNMESPVRREILINLVKVFCLNKLLTQSIENEILDTKIPQSRFCYINSR